MKVYETKVILTAIGQIIGKADSLQEAYEAVAKMANAEGVVLEPFEEIKKNKNQST